MYRPNHRKPSKFGKCKCGLLRDQAIPRIAREIPVKSQVTQTEFVHVFDDILQYQSETLYSDSEDSNLEPENPINTSYKSIKKRKARNKKSRRNRSRVREEANDLEVVENERAESRHCIGSPQGIESVINIEGDNRPHIEVEVLGYGLTGLLDSGASCTILGGSDVYVLLERLGLELIPTESRIKTADGTAHHVKHAVDIPFVIDDKCKVIRPLIVPSIPRDLICGIDFWQAFGIWPSVDKTNDQRNVECIDVTDKESGINQHDLDKNQKLALENLTRSFLVTRPDMLGCTTLLEHKIDTGEGKPVKMRARPLSPYIQSDLNKELDRMIRLGVVEESGPTEWAHPIVCVRKPSGKLRFCLDARKLNDVTVKDTYPLPYINRILGQLSGTRYLSSLDLSDAFWQIELEAASRPKTAFIVPGRGLFQFKRMPFGLCNASQTLCRLMDKVLGVDLEPRVFVYLDDIIVMSQTFE